MYRSAKAFANGAPDPFAKPLNHRGAGWLGDGRKRPEIAASAVRRAAPLRTARDTSGRESIPKIARNIGYIARKLRPSGDRTNGR